MKDSKLDRLEPELRALLHAELAPPSPAAKERVSNRLAQSVAALALNRPVGPAPRAVGARAAARWGGIFRAHSLAFVATFAAGAAFGAGLYAAARHAAPSRVPAARSIPAAPAVTSQPLAEGVSSAHATPDRELTPHPAVATAAPSSSAGRAGSSSLAAQQALLDAARSAFARSDYSATLETLQAHFQRYPKSLLGEEREALEIKALAASGHGAEAQARAARFRLQFPQSVLLPSVNDSVGAIP